MASYAALVSLINTIEQISNHPHFSISLDNKQIKSLQERTNMLLDFVESCTSHRGRKEVEDLENQIASASCTAADAIESIVDQIRTGSSIKQINLHKVIAYMDSIKEKVMEVKEKWGFEEEQLTHSMPSSSSSSRTFAIGKAGMVGFDCYLIQLLDGLTGQQSDRKIISIVGMGGIGKTTLARNIYENLFIGQYFDIRGWANVSQEYNVKEILVEILSSVGVSTRELNGKVEDELGERLYKILSGMRYLIILDDVWSIEAWNKLTLFFPNNYNRSRIIVTTRLSDIANHMNSMGLAMNLLDEDMSWNLFCEKAFAGEGCPLELEEVGKKIVRKCKGLPLSIVVIGGFLGKSSRMQEYWENVAKDLSSAFDSAEDNQCLDILSLSYIHLPAYLKPCLLYFGIFPEDYEIHVSRLIKLWVAEGFLKPNKDRVFEEVAEDCIKDLIDRNLILVHSLRLNGKFKTCYIHDLLRDLCLKIAEKEKFFYVTRLHNSPRDIDMHHHLIIRGSIANEHPPRAFHTLKSIISTSSPI